jgi:hypothetical protein
LAPDLGAIAAGTPFGLVTADEAYGDNGPLRSFLKSRQVSYVLAVSRRVLGTRTQIDLI